MLGSRARIANWLERWGNLLPLFLAEAILWVGFGALLPVMPIYFTRHDVDLATLGIIIAAWPAARLVAEPLFGVVADRAPRVPLMVGGLLLSGAAVGLSLAWTGAGPFIVLRALAGIGTAMYDPAARGIVADATPPERRGEAFGLYGAAQTAGLLFGPALGGFGTALTGGIDIVFWFAAVASALAALGVALRVHEVRHLTRSPAVPRSGVAEFPGEGGVVGSAAVMRPPEDSSFAPTRILNRMFVAAILLNVGSFLAGGIYEVVWSLFLTDRGAGMDLVGLTFAMWGLSVLIVSPIAGRVIDRRGPFRFALGGMIAMIVAMAAYPFVWDVRLVIPLIIVEAVGFAVLNPAIFAIAAAASPAGRSSTAQGIFGAAGTVGTIVAALTTGWLASVDIALPFWIGAIAYGAFVVAGVLVGGRRLRAFGRPGPSVVEEPGGAAR